MSDWVYTTNLPVSMCLTYLLDINCNNLPNDFESFRYDCSKLSDTCLHFIFRGKIHYGRAKRTEYVLNFLNCGDHTRLELHFHRELFGLPPMTAVQELDEFFARNVRGTRIQPKCK